MLNKTISTVLLGTCLVTSSFASSFWNKFYPVQKLHYQTVATQKNTLKQNYTDFSGNWSGTCSGNDEIQTLIINNDSFYIELDGQQYSIGEMLSESSSSKWSSSNLHFLLTWNTERTVLKNKAVFVNTNWTDGSSDQTLMTANLETTFSMSGDELIVQTYQVNSDGVPQQGTENKCTFHKTA
ncbi:hypothetical protein [Legionella parisiensis]|uniref:Lipocalin-like domain-containing protein n=1 Tax=Legionella parisiensis TaxID=45071 RepID=A0A1E5JMG0_9GAMM|nr:hypothetical protein [Legionella parisiensis]KTD40524.1 hypothetical protein Lpar_1841 [Legionella parisiensis]OEH45533.1 hypothetical protein lpari_03492 [Legionella parisiensis]STX72243.1 Uncharacterised protein [Legionella parisiensis]